MDTKHTPGEWYVPSHICGPDMAIIAGNRAIALVVNDEDEPIEEAEQLANARLMAAAPSLLAALRGLADRFRDWSAEDEAALAVADAAVAKAEGRA
jgi:hypothetical protein